MDGASTVLVVASRNEAWSGLIEALTEAHGYRTLYAGSFEQAVVVLGGGPVDLVIAEQAGAGSRGCELLEGLRTSHPDVVRVVALDRGPHDLSRAAVYQFLHLPLDPAQACLVIQRGLEARALARRHRMRSREPDPGAPSAAPALLPLANPMRFEQLVYASEQMAGVCHEARVAARTDLPILIQGETGTGKELLARAIHDHSQRRSGPLLVQSCGGTPDEMLQSELFGHKRGAFTGAFSDQLGLLRAANGGTVFLDEISEISSALQVSLLRFLQDGELKPLGADQAVASNVRIIAASTRPLEALVGSGELRRDLYYRLKGFELAVPALRERATDIAPLAELFVVKHSEETQRRTLGISARALEKLVGYTWPGNVRELETEIRRLVALTSDGEDITTQHMSPALLAAPRGPAPGAPWSGHGKTLRDQVQSLEKHLVHETLERCHWNQSKAAGELGLSRVGLANKIRRYGLAEA